MKKLLIVLSTLFAFCCLTSRAQEPVVSITTVIANQKSYASGYDKEFQLAKPGSDLSWTARCFSNNNSGWNDIRCGSKSAATTATLTTDFAIADPIAKVEIELTRYKTGSTNRMTSMSLLVSRSADMSEAAVYPCDIDQLPSSMGSSATISVDVAEPSENMFYQLCIEMPKVSSEGVFSVNSVKYFGKELTEMPGAHALTLDFTDATSLLDIYCGEGTILAGGDYGEAATNNLDGAKFRAGAVEVSIRKAEGSIQPRWWESKVISPELRLNPGNVIDFHVVDNGYKLYQVSFFQGGSVESYFESLDLAKVETNLGASAIENRTWTVAADNLCVNQLTLTINDYGRCGGMRIIYVEDENALAGVDETIACDESASDEYYNLQGMKVKFETAPPGIYIHRTAHEVRKVVKGR